MNTYKNNFSIQSLILLLTFGFGFINSNTINAQQNNKFGMLTFNKAVNVSGKQRMLTQKMVKSYLYLLSNPNDTKAKRDLLTSKIVLLVKTQVINQQKIG